MVFEFSTLDFWLTPWGLWRYPVGLMGLLVEGIRLALAHAALRLVLFALRCFALHALRSAMCVCFAFPLCATGGDGFENSSYRADHIGGLLVALGAFAPFYLTS